MKILFCINSIGTLGGIERVTIVKANAFAEVPGNHVFIVFTDKMNFPETVHPISSKVNIINLNVNHWDNNYRSVIEKIIQSSKKFFLHYRRLQGCVKEISPDVIISVGQSEKYIIPLLSVPVKIREVHFNSTYRLFTYKSKLKAKILDFLDFKVLLNFYSKYYLLAKQDKEENFSNNRKISYMPNPASFPKTNIRVPMKDRKPVVIAVGRLNYQKGFETLIRIWAEVIKEVDEQWCLKIIGEGPDMIMLQNLSDSLHLGNRLVLTGKSNDIKNEMEGASILTLTSIYEGFPLVLIEALACGLPIVSFDTKYGPKDIVRESVDGFLIHNKDEVQFKKKLVELINDFDLREKFSIEAYKNVDNFDIIKITNQWMDEYCKLLKKSNMSL